MILSYKKVGNSIKVYDTANAKDADSSYYLGDIKKRDLPGGEQLVFEFSSSDQNAGFITKFELEELLEIMGEIEWGAT